MTTIFEQIRAAAAAVSNQSEQVRINTAALKNFAKRLDLTMPDDDPGHAPIGDTEATASFVLALDAVNFGSGYFPYLRKRPLLSGYHTVAACLRDHVTVHGPITSAWLKQVTQADTTTLFEQTPNSRPPNTDHTDHNQSNHNTDHTGHNNTGQHPDQASHNPTNENPDQASHNPTNENPDQASHNPDYTDHNQHHTGNNQSSHSYVDELMAAFAAAWNQLGDFIDGVGAGSALGAVAAAKGSASRLVRLLAQMPYFRDVHHYRGLVVPMYKRAQITVYDLSVALHDEAPGRFTDLSDLTMFADNLVPHVLRIEGVLEFSNELICRINSADDITCGSEPEVEIRACGIHAVELLVDELAHQNRPCYAAQLDGVLWRMGGQAIYKSQPRHRTRCTYY